MFFILSKTVSYLTQPLVVIVGFLLVSLFVKRSLVRSRLRVVAVALLLFFSNDFLANEVMRAWEVDAIPISKLDKVYEYGIVLSGVTDTDVGPKDRVYFNKGADRVYHTVQLYKMGLIKNILVSGGSGKLVNNEECESEGIRRALLIMGVSEHHIVVECQSRNTHESSVEVAKWLKAQEVKSGDCLLVTSAFHMRRSRGCFAKSGIPMDVFTADFYAHPRNFYFDTLVIPREGAIKLWTVLIREWVGMTAYWGAGYI